MLIREVAAQTGVPPKTIRYYETIGLLPPAQRGANNYRQYTTDDADTLKLVAGARSLGIALDDIADILAARTAGIAPCTRVLETLDERVRDIDRHISALLSLRDALIHLRQEGAQLPQDDVRGEQCVCYLLKTFRDSGRVIIQREEELDE